MAGTRRAVALLSGGMDSCVSLCNARAHGFEIMETIWVGYEQKNRREFESSQKLNEIFGTPQYVVHVPKLTGSSLTDDSIPLRVDGKMGGVAPSFVPARNIVFLAIAANRAQVYDADAIVIGVHANDHEGYPDCRPAFIESMQSAISHGMAREVQIYAPVLNLWKSDIARMGAELGAPVEHTWSCYFSRELHCGVCDSCRVRLEAFAKAGLTDPVEYEGRP